MPPFSSSDSFYHQFIPILSARFLLKILSLTLSFQVPKLSSFQLGQPCLAVSRPCAFFDLSALYYQERYAPTTLIPLILAPLIFHGFFLAFGQIENFTPLVSIQFSYFSSQFFFLSFLHSGASPLVPLLGYLSFCFVGQESSHPNTFFLLSTRGPFTFSPSSYFLLLSFLFCYCRRFPSFE